MEKGLGKGASSSVGLPHQVTGSPKAGAMFPLQIGGAANHTRGSWAQGGYDNQALCSAWMHSNTPCEVGTITFLNLFYR